jgi:hypothetical protein
MLISHIQYYLICVNLILIVQNGSGTHPASYPKGTRALSLGVKRPGREADNLPPSSVEIKECVELYLLSPIRFHGVVLS